MKIEEAFNSSYPLIRLNSDTLMFDTDVGNSYQILFDEHESDDGGLEVEVVFNFIDPKNMMPYRKFEGDVMMKKDNPMKIFSTVAKATQDYVRKKQPDIIAFTGRNQLGSVYERMVKKLFNLPNYSLSIKRGSMDTYFIFDRIQ